MPDDDLARLLPEPPPPRAAGREAAIGAAMRRFDGEAPAPRPATAWQRPTWTRVSRTQMGAFASIALVAVIGIPLALTSLHERFPAASPSAPAPSVAGKTAPAPAGQPAVTATSTPAAVPSLASLPQPETRATGAAAPSEAQVADSVPAPAPTPAAEAKAAAPCGSANGCGAELVVQGSARAPAQLSAAPVAVTAMESLPFAATDSASSDVVVTGSRIARPAAASRRGDWNACTIDDPSHSLAGCKGLVDPAAHGVEGQAAQHVAEGLSLAWEGDYAGAIEAFDAAIALQPRRAFTYLNRGLAYARQGELDRAIADLNRAIRHAPTTARGYYHRSLLYEQKGNHDRARDDAARAIDIDPRYRAPIG